MGGAWLNNDVEINSMGTFIRAVGSLLLLPLVGAFFFIVAAYNVANNTAYDYGALGVIILAALWVFAFPLSAVVNCFFAVIVWFEWICTGDF